MQVRTTIRSLLGTGGISTSPQDADSIAAVQDVGLSVDEFHFLRQAAGSIGFSDNFTTVVRHFRMPAGRTPAGYRIEWSLQENRRLVFDLVRDIGYEENGRKRAIPMIFSADSANPYEVAPIRHLIGNLTCNPGIIYDLFINNPKANVGHKFGTREEVIEEIGAILGPGCDISVELNDPFEPNLDRVLEEIAPFEKILSRHRLIVKVPHTGPVNRSNVRELLVGDGRLSCRYDQGSTEDYLRGHNLALKLREQGYRINFTLMFEPHQVPMALQVRPTFINAFVRHRLMASAAFSTHLDKHRQTGDMEVLERLRDYMVRNDYLADGEPADASKVKSIAETYLKLRRFAEPEGEDGLDNARAGLRWLRTANLDDTRLIICSMEGDFNYPDLVRMLADPEFAGMQDRVVITAEPNYLARFTSTPQVVSYQRRFMRAAASSKAPAVQAVGAAQ
jgi:hypothetical protein